MRTKKFKTAQGFLQNHYDRERYMHERRTEWQDDTNEAKIARSKRSKRDAIRALLSAIGLQAKIDDDEDLKQAILRIKQSPEAQNDRHQYFLDGAHKWLKKGQIIVSNVTVTTSSNAARSIIYRGFGIDEDPLSHKWAVHKDGPTPLFIADSEEKALAWVDAEKIREASP